MDMMRKVAMVAATLSVALGAGYTIQNSLVGKNAPQRDAQASDRKPTGIKPLAAGLGGVPNATMPEPTQSPAPKLPEAAFAPTPEPGAAENPAQADAMTPEAASPATMTENATPATGANISPPDTVLSGDSTNCPISLDLIASAQATIDITLIAPCRTSERVVLRHGGLTVTAQTSLTGTLFTSLPGMEPTGRVTVLFGDSVEAVAKVSLPDLPEYRRFAVQWMAEDAFQLSALEGGASFGDAGNITAANPGQRLPGVEMKGGYMSVLGDASVPLPMLAEVYTYPVDKMATVDLSIEAEVTEATCNRELLGEVLYSDGGAVTKTDLTMATPACDAVGDVLVLNDPLPDVKLANLN
ncbi:hypothetical protein [Pseudorhodobacter sp.]|uniref:hypothetical protein n=1 Tax=Pseudorhodobacter sp. TaxID=1934400 RepID=UPI002647F6EF|nr:hypothetical protein [Pseudorhodobacter sp.]MDN5785799.1 hypothetical protein [Pseudorhodobacter sp.]